MGPRQQKESSPARHQQLSFKAASRLKYLRATVAGAYVCGILLARRLWFGAGRTFPRAPIVDGLPTFLLAHDYLLAIPLLVALLLLLISKRPRRYLIAVVTLTILLVLCDLTRLQPWVYQYLLMLSVLACCRSRASDLAITEPIVAAQQLIIVALYFWSGVQKLNWSFGHEVVPGLLELAGIHLSAALLSYVPAVSVGIALCEALIGIGLLFRRTRPAAVLAALSTHALVLWLLVAGTRNSVVLPWNIGMMLMVLLLFWRADDSLFSAALWRESNLANHAVKAVFIICGLAPALSFDGWWDMYLSAALYSGNSPVAVMRINEPARTRLPALAQQQIFVASRGELMLPFFEWSSADLNVPPYPETRVYRRLARQLCAYQETPEELELIVKERPALFDGSYSVTRTKCPELLAH